MSAAAAAAKETVLQFMMTPYVDRLIFVLLVEMKASTCKISSRRQIDVRQPNSNGATSGATVTRLKLASELGAALTNAIYFAASALVGAAAGATGADVDSFAVSVTFASMLVAEASERAPIMTVLPISRSKLDG